MKAKLGIPAALVFASLTLRSQTPPQFAVTDLGSLPGFAVSEATAISSNGIVTGYSAGTDFNITVGNQGGILVAGKAQGWIYSGGALAPIPIPSAGTSPIPLGVNKAGQVVGIPVLAGALDNTTVPSIFFFQNGQYNTPNALLDWLGIYGPFRAAAIADSGQAALSLSPEAFEATISNIGPMPVAAFWNGSASVLPLPSGCAALQSEMSFNVPELCFSQAFNISANSTWLAGFVRETMNRTQLTFLPALWNSAAGTVSLVDAAGVAVSVNNSGQAVGINANGAALFSTTANAIALGANWYPMDINNSGWIVGATGAYQPPGMPSARVFFGPVPKGSSKAVLSTLAGKQYDLLSLVNNSAGWELDYAYAVNDANQIVGTGFHNGVQTAFLLTPVIPPSIAGVVNAEGGASVIAPNTWVEIDGANMAPLLRTWQASDFVNNQMPVALSGVSVTMNGEKAFVYYISQTQIDVLTPPDLAPGPVQVIVTVNGISSMPATVPAQAVSPSFFINGGGHYILAQHADRTLVGPVTLNPGQSTPALPGEEIVLYANGFGAISPPVASGAAQQSGSLPVLPAVTIGGTTAQVLFAGLISPGLYQLNVVVPSSASSGDQAVATSYGGASTQAGALLTVR